MGKGSFNAAVLGDIFQSLWIGHLLISQPGAHLPVRAQRIEWHLAPCLSPPFIHIHRGTGFCAN